MPYVNKEEYATYQKEYQQNHREKTRAISSNWKKRILNNECKRGNKNAIASASV